MSNMKDRLPYDENGLPHGEWLFHKPDGKLFYCTNFVHGVRHGLEQGYDDDGTLRYYGYWNMGRMVGYWRWDKQKRYYLCIL